MQFLRLQGQPFTSSSHSCSTEQQQQQQGSSKAHDQGSDSNSKSQHGSNVQQEAQQAAKGLLSKSLDMEELWFAAVGGKLKVWSAKTYPELKVSLQTLLACLLPSCTHPTAGRRAELPCCHTPYIPC